MRKTVRSDNFLLVVIFLMLPQCRIFNSIQSWVNKFHFQFNVSFYSIYNLFIASGMVTHIWTKHLEPDWFHVIWYIFGCNRNLLMIALLNGLILMKYVVWSLGKSSSICRVSLSLVFLFCYLFLYQESENWITY